MKLNEVFDSSVDWKQTHDVGGQRKPGEDPLWSGGDHYYFQIGNIGYRLVFHQSTNDDREVLGAPFDLPEQFDLITLFSGEVDDEESPLFGKVIKDAKAEITGTGNAFKAFSTVGKIVKQHMKKTKLPVVVQAQLDEPSRVKLYSKLFDKIAARKWKTNQVTSWLILAL